MSASSFVVARQYCQDRRASMRSSHRRGEDLKFCFDGRQRLPGERLDLHPMQPQTEKRPSLGTAQVSLDDPPQTRPVPINHMEDARGFAPDAPSWLARSVLNEN